MLKVITALLSGFIFAIGLGISGMTQPQKVVAFLDLFGVWNPSLAFVMIGAIGTHGFFYFIFRKKFSPILDSKFYLPYAKDIDFKLVTGSVLFGVGWGLGGFCPGPAITSLASGSQTVLTFVASMVVGMFIFKLTQRLGAKR